MEVARSTIDLARHQTLERQHTGCSMMSPCGTGPKRRIASVTRPRVVLETAHRAQLNSTLRSEPRRAHACGCAFYSCTPCEKTCRLNDVRCAHDCRAVSYSVSLQIISRAFVRYICSKGLLTFAHTETRKRVPQTRRRPRHAHRALAAAAGRGAMATPASRFAIRRPAAPSSWRNKLLAHWS